MPLYDYRCTDCGREVEVSHGIHAAGPATCESCGGPMRKALSAPAIHFKGSGWAKKDARSAAKPTSPAAPSADAGTSASTPRAGAGEASTTGPATGTTTGGGGSDPGSGTSGSGSGPASPSAGFGGRTE